MSRIDELKQQIAQLDELMSSGVLSTAAAHDARERLQAELLAVIVPPSGAATAANASAEQPRPSSKLLLGIAVFILVFAAGGYAWLGNLAGLSADSTVAGTDSAGSSPHATDPAQIEAMIDRLNQRLKTTPDDADGWAILGRSYSALGRQSEALQAYKKVIELRPKDAQGYADIADAIATDNGNRLDGEPEKLIAKALTLDPDNVKALALSGTIAFDRGDAATATDQWEHALRGVEPGSGMATQLQGALKEARQLAGLPPQPAASAAVAGNGKTIQGRVTLSDKIKALASPEDTVFVFARSAQGGGKAPLAVLRKKVKDLPFDFTLDDSLAMNPAMSLSTSREVQVGARISKSGNPMPQPGDLQGLTATVSVGAKDIKLEINEAIR